MVISLINCTFTPILKTYKENNIVYVDEKTDRREGVTA